MLNTSFIQKSVYLLWQSIRSTIIASHLAVHGFIHLTNVEKIPEDDKMGVIFHMFLEIFYINHIHTLFTDCVSFVYSTFIYRLPK